MLLNLLFLTQTTYALSSWLGLDSQYPLSRCHDLNDYQPFTEDFNVFVNNTLSEFLAPGLAVAIVQGDATYAKGYGYSNIEQWEEMTPQTLFFAGSTTKSFTAATMSKLVESNESAYAAIEWDSKLASLIREDFVLSDAYASNHISLTDALSHRTGMPRHDISWVNGNVSVKQQVEQLRHLPFHRELRAGWEYCNLMFTAVSHTIETVTKSSMATLLKQWMWEPLGMHETFYNLADALNYAENSGGNVTMATGYLYDNVTGHSMVPVPFSHIPPENGAGGVISNVLDYAKWIRTFLHPENSSNPISAQTVKKMTSAHMPVPGTSWPYTGGVSWYGLGLTGGIYKDLVVNGHDGAINGYMTSMLWVPERDFGVAVMQNAYSLAATIVLWEIIDDFLQVPVNEKLDGAAMARKYQADQLTRLANSRERLYPGSAGVTPVKPSLPLQAYEGTYRHPAYHEFTVTTSRGDTQDVQNTPPSLFMAPAEGAYLNVSATLQHVNGEHWLAQFHMGTPGNFMVEDAVKSRFEIGVSGNVQGLWFQAEPALAELAWFEKV
ncbi:beta-lactamase/transpeptidase-like protein [Hortaea werneckii]|uniref:Beta-lactamase-related domain-containing protein n=1 Tax=Hortaea werneckii TaxID=91943 RepID=A0A3M7G655_HORWE|nr:beta-lactamase/transpeptidase-like protein [Hortaea werneckii]KAI7140957.1 beta-lactamase/transpeptidase-like protein [Hortaea werneckii]KAI7543480.1 beta-lactamase/transpeptidase-like protein [Hortaea werneckii]KAI7592228.1 beta-lactamase/transpeptidase-like protein [Hortaea werneckii]KAI7598952.1 beta-lactamase/transpeptidase-like protein [Hortaea werneckii]